MARNEGKAIIAPIIYQSIFFPTFEIYLSLYIITTTTARAKATYPTSNIYLATEKGTYMTALI